MNLHIRPETAADWESIRHVNTLAFGRSDEARLVDALRRAEALSISLVADKAGSVIGHVAFSPVHAAEGDLPLLGLAPLAVHPDFQRQGVGAKLMQAGLAAARSAGAAGVLLVGDPSYYGRFGFRAAARWGLHSEWDLPEGVFQAVFFVSQVSASGMVWYHPCFDDLS